VVSIVGSAEKKLAASEIIYRYLSMESLGEGRPLQCWTTRCLTLLPVSKAGKYSKKQQDDIVAALKNINTKGEKPAFKPLPIVVHASKEAELARREQSVINAEDQPNADDIDERDWGDDPIRNRYPNMDDDDTKLKGSKVIDAQAEMALCDSSRLYEVRREMQRIGCTFRDEGVYYKVDRVVIHSADREKWLFFEYYPVTYRSQHEAAPSLNNKLRETTRCCIFEGGKHYSGNPEPEWFVWEEVPEEYDGAV